MTEVRPLVHALLAVAFPEGCPLCGQPIDPLGRAGICTACWSAVLPAPGPRCARCGLSFGPGWTEGEEAPCLECLADPPPFDAGASFGPYVGELAGALRLLKYAGRPRIAAPLADRVLADRAVADWLSGVDALVPVPLHASRRAGRGYDQAEVLARQIGRRLRVPVTRALARRRRTRPQVGQSAAARRRNVRAAFAPGPGWKRVERRTVCLVDDVWTTGATVREASRCLLGARPRAVLAFAVARA